ncbi:MAG: VOC family protein [Hyphomicrobiales bacterium]|nr:VOC family protein [Hyphomicrobiales bacterium]
MRYLNIFLTITFIVFMSSFPSNAKLGFVGIGVSNLEESTEFYKEALGLKVLGTYENIEVDNSDGSKWYVDEVVVGNNETETGLVLMNWGRENRTYNGNNQKIVFVVNNAVEVMQKIRLAGGKIEREALPHYSIDGGLVGLARDPDNYVVEIVQFK